MTPESAIQCLPLHTGDITWTLSPPVFRGYLHDHGRGGFVAGFSFVWVDNFMSFLNFKFRATVGSHFWDLLQEVLQQVLESLSIPEKGIEKSLEILQEKNPFY